VIIIPERRACYIHIPRTGGMALQTAIERALPHSVRLAGFWEHTTAAEIRQRLAWPDLRIFAVIRNPWQIFASHWGWTQRYSQTPELLGDDRVAVAVAIAAQMTFCEFIRYSIERDILAVDGGFFARYCDEWTTIFHYEAGPWTQIAQWLDCELVLERENESLCEPPVWDQETADLVGWYCRGDVERFGYGVPDHFRMSSSFAQMSDR